MSETSHDPARALRRLKNGDQRISYLCFKNKKYEDSTVSELFDYLAEHPDGIIGANLCFNHFTDATGVKLAKWISRSTTLQSLILSNNHFGEPTYLAIAEALHFNLSFKEVILFDNEIVDMEHVKNAFRRAISINPLLYNCNWMLFFIRNEFYDLKKTAPQPSMPPSMLQLLLSTHTSLNPSISYLRFLY